MADATDDLMELRPVTFTYKQHSSGPLQYGLIAEEVAEVFPELVQYGADGEVQTVRYHLLSSMLLNELQKLHEESQIQQQTKDAQIANLESRLEALEQNLGLPKASSAPLSLGAATIWIIGAGLGMLVGGSGLVLGYRRFREGNKDLG